MKQFITNKEWSQFHKNNPKAYDKLVDWIRSKREEDISKAWKTGCTYNEPPNYWEWFHVGRMIEFLDEHREIWFEQEDGFLTLPYDKNDKDSGKELCDAVWEVVKKILEKE